MMRMAGRGDDGYAKALKTDNKGNIYVKNTEESAFRYEKIELSSNSPKHLTILGGEQSVSIEAAGKVSFRIDGGIPSQTEGHILNDKDILELASYENTLKFKAIAIDEGASLNVTFYGKSSNMLNPDVIENMVIRLDASQIKGKNDGDKISIWEDASGNEYHATQTDPNRQLTYREDYLNGNPALTFRSNGSWWMEIPYGQLGKTRLFSGEDDQFTVFIVARVQLGQYGTLLSKTRSTGGVSGRQFQIFYNRPENGIGATPSIYLREGLTSTMQGLESGIARIHTIIWDGSKGVFSTVRGDMALENGSGKELLDEDKIYIGTRDAGAHSMRGGALAEIIIFDRALSRVEREGIEQYLSDKWVGK